MRSKTEDKKNESIKEIDYQKALYEVLLKYKDAFERLTNR